MFDRKSAYALSKKDKEAIVYRYADGYIQRLTCSDFDSETEFLKWKDWSDEDYHAIEKREHIHSDNALSLCGLSDEAASVPPLEDAMMECFYMQEQQQLCILLHKGMAACLTPIQRRRLWLHFVDGMSIEKIAKLECVRHQNVSKSIAAAKRKLAAFLKKQGAKTRFSPR